MAGNDLLGFIWGKPGDRHFIDDAAAGSLEFDCIDSETHEWQRDVTQNPVENGSPVADHIIERPKNLTVTGMISNAPVAGANIFFTGLLTDGEDRVAQAFSKLDALYKSGTLLTLYTRYQVYENMVITGISIPRSPDNGDAIVFTVQATQVRIVSTQNTTLPKGMGVKKQTDSSGKAGTSNSRDPDTQKRGGTEQNNGKSTTEVSNGSSLHKLLDTIMGAIRQ